MDGPERTDAELVDAIRRKGDQGALEVLLARHIRRVWKIVYGLVQNAADADDVTQEVQLHVLKGLGNYRSDATYTTWLYRVATNTAKNFLRSRNRRGSHLASDDWLENVADHSFRTPTGELATAEFNRTMNDAIAQLPLEQRVALTLVVMEQMPEKEAAKVAGCAHATLRWRLFRARMRLQKFLKQAGYAGLRLHRTEWATQQDT